MKKVLSIFTLMLAGCGIPRNADGNIVGRIEYKRYEYGQPYFSVSDGNWRHVSHTCNVSMDEFMQFKIGDIYTCKYQ